jgi:DNA adenine methylase Dam
MDVLKNNYIKSPLNYTGGKYRLLPQILPLFPKNIGCFVDLFCGGLDVILNVEAQKIVANDICKPLIDLYNEMKIKGTDDVYNHIYSKIKLYSLSKTNKDGYLQLRNEYNKYKNPLDLYVLVCYCFNNMIRFNSKLEYNMPFGLNRSDFNSKLEKRLVLFLSKIKNIDFVSKSFEEIKVEKLSNNDFVYVDPPYLISIASYNENGGWNEGEVLTAYENPTKSKEIG